uniref:Uncharacterized protein n=1 Tax=Paramoeba aestuarina TaxID=180227 RepID=A0A7S4KI96_9EUKA
MTCSSNLVMIQTSLRLLTRLNLQQVYSGYQQGSSCAQCSDDFELYDEDPKKSDNQSFYEASTLGSLRLEKNESTVESCSAADLKLSKTSTESTINESSSFIPTKNPYATPSAVQTVLSCAVHDYDTRKNLPLNALVDSTLQPTSSELRPSPFRSTTFGASCLSAITDKHGLSNAITLAMKPKGSKMSFEKLRLTAKSSSDPRKQKLQQKKLNDLIIKEIMMLFRLYKDQQSVIPLHLTKITSELSDDALEYIGEKGGLRKFLNDRPKFFRLKKMERRGGWYVTTSIDICERFAGNFQRSIASTFDEETSSCFDEMSRDDETPESFTKAQEST